MRAIILIVVAALPLLLLCEPLGRWLGRQSHAESLPPKDPALLGLGRAAETSRTAEEVAATAEAHSPGEGPVGSPGTFAQGVPEDARSATKPAGTAQVSLTSAGRGMARAAAESARQLLRTTSLGRQERAANGAGPTERLRSMTFSFADGIIPSSRSSSATYRSASEARSGGGRGERLTGLPAWFRILAASNGQIARDEWRAAGLPAAEFDRMDRDRDGSLTPREVRSYLAQGASGRPALALAVASLSPEELAVSGATTSRVLWQVEQGQVEMASPRVIVLMIGTNNLSLGASPAATAAGITKIVEEIRSRLPSTRILLLGIFPRGPDPDSTGRSEIIATNRLIADLDDGDHVRFLDIGGAFLEDDGTISPLVMKDYVHPTLDGYEIYTNYVWGPLLTLLLED